MSRSSPSTVATAAVSQEPATARGAIKPREDAVQVLLEPGVKVEVRTAFDRTWARGFEVLDASEEGYRLRRLSDGSALPATFKPDDVRRERRDANMWWI